MNLQQVHLRVADHATGQPTPCWIRITDLSGVEYAPFGRSLEFSVNRGEDVGGHVRIGRERWYSIDGQCEMALPSGNLRVQIRKGIQHQRIDEIVNLPSGKMALRFSLQGSHVVSVDGRCHDIAPHDAALDGAADGLSVVNILARPTSYLGSDGNSYRQTRNLAAFSGQTPALDAFGVHVLVNTWNRHPVLGSLGLLNSHRAVFPLSFGPPDETDDWSLRDWAGQCHRKGGLVVWTEPFSPRQPHAGEALALAVLGELDAYELAPDNTATALQPWYQLLAAGVNLPLIGSSARCGNNRPLGAMRTCCWDDNVNWIEAVKSGASCVTNGPMLELTRAGQPVVALATSVTEAQVIELVINGKVTRNVFTGVQRHCQLAATSADITAPAWVAARIVNANTFAHTSAYWLGPPQRELSAIAFLTGHLTMAREWVETEGRFHQARSKSKLLDTFDEALARLQQPVNTGKG